MDFPFSFPCPKCDTKLKIKDESVLGRTIMCPQCGKKMKAGSPRDDVDDPFDQTDEPELLKPLPSKRRRPKSDDDDPRSIGREPPRKKHVSTKSRPTESNALPMILGGTAVLIVSIGMAAWTFGGRIATLVRTDPQQRRDAAERVVDPYAEAIHEATAGERPFLTAAKPFLEAIRARDYAAAYRTLSSHARAAVQPEQFVTPTEENHVALPVMREITEEQFAESMKQMEAARGIPAKVLHLYVQSVDPKVLAGKGDGFDTMLALGGMPKEIPVAIRKASIRAQFECNYSDEQVKQIAQELHIPEEQVRSGQLDADEAERDADEKPYFNLKFVLVEEAGELKIGYFEFIPPSIFD